MNLPPVITAKVSEKYVVLNRAGNDKQCKSLHGTYYRLLQNAIIGLATGFEKKLEYKGVGFTVNIVDNKLVMRLGFSHQIEIVIPDNVLVTISKNVISVSGTDKEKVGLFAAKVRATKKPEVYKGKGIRYQNEYVRKKAGKAAQSASA